MELNKSENTELFMIKAEYLRFVKTLNTPRISVYRLLDKMEAVSSMLELTANSEEYVINVS